MRNVEPSSESTKPPHHARRRGTNRFQPGVDSLERREVLSAGPPPVPVAFLFTPISQSTPLAEHIHPHLTILIDGQPQIVPQGIGLGPNGNLPLHTHDSSGTIHVESNVALPFRLQDFFTIWGQPFSSRNVLGHVADRTHRITMTVNGHPSRAFGSLLLQDGQNIVIRFTTLRHRGR